MKFMMMIQAIVPPGRMGTVKKALEETGSAAMSIFDITASRPGLDLRNCKIQRIRTGG
jgi:hypothetical protein